MAPKVGLPVVYLTNGADAEICDEGEKQHAAIVTEVHSEDCVDLQIFAHGRSFVRNSVNRVKHQGNAHFDFVEMPAEKATVDIAPFNKAIDKLQAKIDKLGDADKAIKEKLGKEVTALKERINKKADKPKKK